MKNVNWMRILATLVKSTLIGLLGIFLVYFWQFHTILVQTTENIQLIVAMDICLIGVALTCTLFSFMRSPVSAEKKSKETNETVIAQRFVVRRGEGSPEDLLSRHASQVSRGLQKEEHSEETVQSGC